jgi:phosphate transport system substrate-binding protein
MFFRSGLAVLVLGLGALTLAGCGPSNESIRMEGSTTMLLVAQGWAEKYQAQNPNASIQVSGGGSGAGIASLIDGTCDLAIASRIIEDKEAQRLWDKRHLKPRGFVVGYDALAIYVNKDNPLDSISLDELAEIFGEGGKITKWSQLGVHGKQIGDDTIVRIGRHDSSGTYVYFREAVLGGAGRYKPGSLDQDTSADVVASVAGAPGAIGYSGMGFATSGVKTLSISRRKGQPALAPTIANAKRKVGGYPITRRLLIYTAGEPKGEVNVFLDWVLGEQGQKVVLELGFVPVRDN